MPRLTPIDLPAADPQVRRTLDGVHGKLGLTPNIMTTMAHSPAVLDAYLAFGQALGRASLEADLREQIAVTVAGANSCEYCAAAHTALGRSLGVDERELGRNLAGDSADPRTAATLRFARTIVEQRGLVSDEDVEDFRAAGFGDAQIAEVVATVAINVFTNYFNHVAGTEIDFPAVRLPQPVAG